MSMRRVIAQGLWLLAVVAPAALAWGPRGHQASVDVAQRLLAGTRAEREVQALLQPLGWTLAQAAIWPDCLRAVDEQDGQLVIDERNERSACRPFDTPAGRAQRVQAVAQLAGHCDASVPVAACHRRLHYTDVAIQRAHWALGQVGVRDDDLVMALQAAIRTLQGRTPRGPVRLGSRAEALAWLVHLVGDVHQPLHVGSLYLDDQGQAIDPDRAHPALDTVGGNRLMVGRRSLHSLWDEVPRGVWPAAIDERMVAEARAIAPLPGPADTWPQRWADETLGVARLVLAPLAFEPADGEPPQWTQRSPDDADQRALVQRRQLLRAGARLAQVLQALWP